MTCMPSRSRRLFDDELILPRVLARIADAATQLVQELVHPREAFLGRIDRAIDERFLVVVPGGNARSATTRSCSSSTGRPDSMPCMRPAGDWPQASAGPAITMSPVSG